MKRHRAPEERRDARATERWLFLWAFLAVAAGQGMLLAVRYANAPEVRIADFLPLGVYLCAFVAVHLFFVWIGFRGDPLLPASALFLAGFGFLAQVRMGIVDWEHPGTLSNLAFPGALAAMLAVVGLFHAGRWKVLRPLSRSFYAAAVLTLGAILVFGSRYRGGLFLAGHINPAEIIKVFLVLFLAGYIADHENGLRRTLAGIPVPAGRDWLPLAGLWLVPMLLLGWQRDLGMIIQLNGVLILLLFLATGRRGYLLAGCLLAAVVGVFVFHLLPHGQQRFLVWQDPFQDPTGSGWQTLQALSALYSGGLWGTGMGAGFPHAIPVASTDFMYAVIGEELGYAGCGLLLLIYAFVIDRSFRLAGHLRQTYPRMAAAGLTLCLAIQVLLNVAGVTKALPLTGITLPFVSHGGSSLVTSFILLGLLLVFSEGDGVKKDGGKTFPRSACRKTIE